MLVIATLFVVAPFAPAVNTQRVVADIEVAFPSGLAYDSGRSEIFALSPNYSEVYAGTIVVISDATDQVVATISAGSGPSGSIHLLGAAYDSERGAVFVTDAVEGQGNHGTASMLVTLDVLGPGTGTASTMVTISC